MSKETSVWLNTNTLIGFTDTRGNAWHYRAEDQGAESNHFKGPVPVEKVLERLFYWTAEEAPVQYTRPEVLSLDGVTPASVVTDNSRKVVYRSDTGHVMGVFSDGYERHQFSDWLVDTATKILGEGVGIGSAGLLDGGAVGWVQYEVEETLHAPGGVRFRPHLLAMTSHNGKRATGFARTVTNTVCDNTLAVAASERGQKIKYKHTRNSAVKIDDARQALSIIGGIGDDFIADVERFLSVKVSDQQWQKIVEALAPVGESKRSAAMAATKLGELNRLYKYDERVAPWAGTGWGVMQAVNTYDQHLAIARNLGDGNKGAARYDRSLMAATSGELDKQRGTVAELLSAVC